MNDLPPRPDPDRLLARMARDERAARRGSLRIFFGFAPGVGKTYRMLAVARELVNEGRDVVIGIVEDHRRAETAAMTEGFETLGRRALDYRGRTLREFDLDAALARRPSVLLVDELAHTNAPGSRHVKRWQDIEELLDAGIDVLSTLNVQHVESLVDVVAQITKVTVRETVPDSVLDRADVLELVDISPEELASRLRDGKVYLGDQATRARAGFFRRGNLLALRELALRRTAQRVDADVIRYREDHGVATTWPAAERILVCVGPAPSSARLIRAAARLAAGLRCEFVAAYVEVVPSAALDERDQERLDQHLRLAESLGGSLARLSGLRVPDALLTYARANNITRILLGKPTHSRLRDRLRGSLLDDIVRGSGEIDVHVIRGTENDEPPRREEPVAAPRAFDVRGYVAAVALVGLALATSLGLRRLIDLPDLEMLFLLAVMASGAWFGRGPSTLAAALGVACYDYFLVSPVHTFSVADRRYVLTFAMMFGVGYAMSALASRIRRHERDAIARESRTATLYALTRELAGVDDPRRIAASAARHAAEVFSAEVALLHGRHEDQLVALASEPTSFLLDDKDLGVAHWTFRHDEPAGLGTATLPGARVLCAPLRSGGTELGVLALAPRSPAPMHADQRAFLDVFCRQVSSALERAALAEDARLAALRAKTEEMRASLLSAVSHDLRTPLATITGAATTLRDGGGLGEETKSELVEAIVGEAERLERLVANLLDMTRLESGAIALRRDWVPLDEIVGSALTRLEARLGERPVEVAIGGDVPLVLVDPVLFEQVFVNLLENAEKYTPTDTAIAIRASRGTDAVVVDVHDDGPGLPSGSESRIFEKFVRGDHAGIAGAGLGLAICKGIVEAHGGTIAVVPDGSSGTTFRIRLPIEGTPPTVDDQEGPA